MAKMTSIKMKRLLEDRLKNPDYRIVYKRDDDALRIEWRDSGQGMTVSLPNLITKYNNRGDIAIQEMEEHIIEALKIMNETHHLQGMEKHIFPVLRSPSFPIETKAGKKLIYKDHTAETRVFYALDLGKSYRLIDEELLMEEEWTAERLDEIASFNVRSLSHDVKKDQVADNDFYFLATQDGYDASRILNEAFLEEMKANAQGELTVAVPHQDVLIIADIKNKMGYDILAQMTMKFFAEGRIPITSLSFVYEDRKLEPIFILAKNKPENK
ncbi:DUF1444 domain-containing protein [Oceanobacillus kimchii]|uniref:DUF1444 domain-containing protein n=1 Tax=Oceanobacillus kimchii TaxID=746691 RepID=UPI0009841CE3|nr:DUF1444 domain-containing protein [Oceanobacillus kimchii]